MNFSIGNLNGTNANISSLISDLIARKSSAMNTLLEQKSSIETSLAALQNSALGTGSINNSYSSQIASLQDTIDTLKEQYTINSNKLSTINSLNNSYKKVVSTLDDYIESLKNPNKNDTTPTWTNSNSNVADVTINSNGASIQRVDLTVTQLATTSIIKSEFLSGGSISLDTKITDLFAGKYDSATNTITSTRTDLNENIKLSELGITNGSFKLGSHTIRVDSSKTLGDLMNEINSLGGYTAKLETTYDANGNAVSSFSITGSNGKSVGITNVANALNIKGNMTSDTKLSQLGIESGVYQVGNQQITVDAKKDTVGSLIEKISSAGYNASIVNDPDNAGSKKLLITDASGDEVVNETASNFASVIGLTVSEGNFTINGESFDINASTTIGSLINDINKATADGVGAKLENNKLVFVASKTGEIDINVGKGTSNFTNAIGFTVGGVMNKDNLVMGSDGSYVTLAGLNQGIKNTDSVKNGKFTTGNFTISYNKIDKNGVALDEMLTTEINITEDDTVESIIQKIKDQTQQTYTDKNGNIVTTSLTAEIVDGKFQIRQTQKGAQYKIAVSAGSSTFTEYVGLTQKVNPGVATSGSATTFTGIKDVTADMTFSEGNFKITASKANDPSQTESVVIDVAQGETLQSVIDKINDSGLAITAQIKDGKLQLMHNNYGADYSISVEAGSSDFTNKVGFTAETSVGVSNNGTNSTLTGLVGGFTLNSASFTEGSFVLQTNALSSDGKTASDDMLSAVIEVKSTDTIQDIINKINSATVNYNGQDVSLGLTASLTADGKIQIQQNNGGEGFDIKVEAGDTNFTQKVGLTTSVSTGVSSSATVSYVIGSSSYDGTFSGGSFKISTNAVDESGKGAAFDMLSVDVNIQEGSKLNDDLINSINSQINSIGLHASITSDGKIKIEQLNAGADFDIKIEAGNTNFTQKTGLTTDVQNIGTLTPGRDVNQFTSLTGINNVTQDTAVSQGTFKINGVTINFNDGNIASAIEQINALKDQTGVNAYLKDGKVVLQANVTGPDTTIYVENGTSSFGEVAGFISQSSMGGSATIGQVGSKTTLTGAYDVSDDTTVSGGTIKINGYDIVIDSGSLKDAIDKINSASDKTGVTADIVNNRFVLTNTTNSTNSISVEAGSSDIAQKTGIAAYQSKQGTQEIKNATKSALKASKQNLSGAESITNSSITINGQKIDLSGNVNSAINQINNYSSTTGVKAYLDEDGRFTLENIETGKKAISVSFVSGDFGKVIGAVASSGSGSSSGSSNSGNITVTPGGDIIVTPGGNNSNINGGSNSSSGSSSFIQGGNSNLNNNSQIIGGGSLNIGEKDYSASVSRMTEEEALAKGYTVVKTADELYEAMLLDEQNIILMNDIDFSAFSTINSFTGTLDGNGYTLSNISGYLIESAENATIKNLAVNSSGSYNLDSLIYEAANTTLDTVYIVGFDSAIKNAFDEINISDAIIGGQSGGYGFIETVHAADVTIKNSLNFMSANPGGLLIGSNENGNVTIKNAYGAGTGDIIGSNTGTVTIENVYNLDNSQFEDVQVITDGIDGLLGIPGFVKDNNSGLPISEKLANTFTSIFTEGYTKPGVSVDLSDCNTIGDVIDKINATNSGYVASLENGKFTIRKEGSTEEFTVDYSGAGNFGYVTGLEDYTIGKATGTKRLTEAEAIAQGYTIIKTAQDLQNIKNNLGGKYILMGDIDLSSISAWEAIGATESSAFSGTFDGNGYSIKNLTTGFALYNGLFGVVTGTIKNLNLDNVRIDTVTKPDGTSTVSTSAGAVAGWLKGTISNVSVTNSYIYGGLMAGGLVGSSGGNITNSYTENTTVTGNGYLGGLTGSLTGVISHSYSLSQVIAKGGTNLTGAITGGDGDTTKTGSINDVYFDSRISGVTTAVGPSGTLASETLVKDLANLTGSFDSSIWNTSGEHPTLWASSKSLTGATVYGLTENTIFAGLQSGSLSVDVEGTTFNVQLSGTDTLKESLEKIKAEFEKRGFEFNYKIDGGKVIIASDKYFTFDNNNEFIKLSGLSTEGVTYKANFTSGIEYGSNVLTGSVSGLTLDTVLNGLNNGSYTIKQGGQNAFTFTASSTDTIGDIINKINAGGMYIAGLDEEGRFYIESGGSASANSTLNSIAADGTEFVKITEAEAKSQGYTVVKTAQEFLAAIKGHTNANTQAKIILMNDIDFGGMSIDSISDFYGEINGNGYTLSNLNINGSALFDNTNWALIQNAIISDFHVKTESDYVGPAAVVFGNACHAIFDNVILQNSSVETDGYAGGLIASLVDSCSITNTVVSNTVLNGQMGSGGFVGVCGQSGMTLNISNSGVYNITNTTQNNYSSNGGLVAYVHRSPMINVTNTYVYFDPAFTAASNQNWYAIAGDTEVLGTLFTVSGNFTSNGIVPDNFTPGGTGTIDISQSYTLEDIKNKNQNIDWQMYSNGGLISSSMASIFNIKNNNNTNKPVTGNITIESDNGGNFDILAGLNGASILTGGVGGLKEDMVIAGQAGSYTIDQNGKNAFTLTIDADDTVGDVINKINASGMYKAYLDKDGKLVIATASVPSQSTPEVPSNNGVVSGANDVKYTQLTEEQAIAQGYTVIKSASDFMNINNNLSGKYILMNDIDFSGISNMTPIGGSEAFSGILEGNGFAIRNLTISNSSSMNTGLFGRLENAKISNLGIINSNITSTYSDGSAGTLAGGAVSSTITNITIESGYVTGSGAVGGIIGSISGSSSISLSTFIGSVAVNGSGYAVGGIVGFAGKSELSNNYSNTHVYNESSYSYNLGGIAGQTLNSTLSYNYFHGTTFSTASNNSTMGGIVGSISSTTAEHNYALGGNYGYLYLFGSTSNLTEIGSNEILTNPKKLIDDGIFSSDIWDITYSTVSIKQVNQISALISQGTVNINGTSIELTDGSIEEAISKINEKSSQTGVVASIENNKVVLKNTDGSTNNISVESGTSNFFDVAGIETSAPARSISSDVPVITGNVGQAEEVGSIQRLTREEAIAQGYTIIDSAQGLLDLGMMQTLSGRYILMGDIDLSSFSSGNYSFLGDLTGEFNGNGYTIKNLNIQSTVAETNIGLFSKIDGGTVKNLNFENANVSGEYRVGILAGSALGSATIDNVNISNSSVSSPSGIAGSLIGFAGSETDTIQVRNTHVTNTVVEALEYAGGLIGSVQSDLSIEQSSFSGGVSAGNIGGGLIGGVSAYGTSANTAYKTITIKDSYSDAAYVDTGSRPAYGGFFGEIHLATVEITSSYAKYESSYNTVDAIAGRITWMTNGSSMNGFETNIYTTDVYYKGNFKNTNTMLTYSELTDSVIDSGVFDSSIWDTSGSEPVHKQNIFYALTGATVEGMTADTVVSGYKNSTAVFSSRDVNVQIETKPTDTVSDIMNQFKTQVEAQGYTFDWSISNGQITVTTNAGSFFFDGPDDNALVAMGLKSGTLAGSGSTDDSTDTDNTIPEVSTDPISFTSNGTGTLDQSLGFAASSVLTGATGGLSLDTKVSGSGSYVIAQEGQNSFTLNVENGDTIGNIINKINASGQYTAGLDENGKFFISAKPSQTPSIATNHISEAEAIAQGYTIIRTANDLSKINTTTSGKFILANDIDMTGINWSPLSLGANITFELNGNGYSIKNLTVTGVDNAALIGSVGNKTDVIIKNLALTDVNISGNMYAAGFIAKGKDYTTFDSPGNISIENSSVTGTIEAIATNDSDYVYAGGLVATAQNISIKDSFVIADVKGYLANGAMNNAIGGLVGICSSVGELSSISNSFFNGNVSGSNFVGGIIGDAYKTTIDSCYTSGNITAEDNSAGGITGYAMNTIISNVYSNSNIYGDYSGGIVGSLDTNSSLSNAVFNGTIASNSHVGAIVGGTYGNLTITNTYWNADKTGDINGYNEGSNTTLTATSVQGLTSGQFVDASNFNDLDSKIWDLSGSIPTLKNLKYVSDATIDKISVTAQEGATSNFESLVGFKTITLTGGVTGLTRETAGLTAGSFTIAQDGANAFTFEVKATDTVGDVIDRINAGGQYTASLDDQGRFVISAGDNAAKVYFGSKTGLSLDDTTLEHTDAYRETLRNGGHGTNNTYSDVIVGPTKFVIKTHKCVDGIEINLTDSSTTYQDIADAINAYSDELEVEAKFDSNGEFDIEGTETYYDDDRNGKFIKIEANYSECENFANGTGFIDSEGNCYTGMWHSIYSEYMSTSIYDGETGEYKGSGKNFRVDAGDTIQDIIDKINSQTKLQAGLDSLGRLYIASKDNPSDIVKIGAQIPYENSFIKYTGLDNLSAGTLPPGEITITQNSGSNSNFLEVTGFETEQSGSMEEVLGSDGYIQVTGSVTGLKASDVLGGLTKGTFTITQGANNINIAIESTDSLQDIIDKINATGKYTASIDSKGRFTIVSKEAGSVNLEFGGTSNFAGLAGLSEYTVEDNSITSIGTYDKYSTLTGNAYVNTDMTFSEGNFILSLGDKSVEFHVSEGETITSIINKINNSDLGVSASIQNNKFVFTAKNPGTEEIRIQDGTSNFAELTGFIGSGGSQANSVVKGQLSTYTSTNTAMSAQNQGISSGNFFVHLTDNNGNITYTVEIKVNKNESINSIIEKINNSGLGVTASINDSGKMVITRNSSDTAGGVLVTRGSSDFTNKIGFTSGGYQSAAVQSGKSGLITSTNAISSTARFSAGDFTIRLTGKNAGDYTVDIAATDSIEAIIDKINALDIGVTASLDANNKLVIKRDADAGEGSIEIIKGSSDFTNILGFTSGGTQSATTVEGDTAQLTSLSAVSSSKRFTEGDFTISLTGQNAKDITINIAATDTINDIVDKINAQNAGVSAYINADKKLVITRDANMGEGGIEIKKGSSNFTNEMGFTTGGDALVDDVDGSSAVITGSTPVNTAESSGYSAGNFYIQMYNKDGSKGDLIQIDVGTSGINGAVDSVATIVNTINSKNAGITASIVNGKLVLTRDQDQAAGSFEIIKGSSDFTNKIGLTSGGNYIGDTTQGDAATQTVLTSDGLGDLLVRDSMTLGSIGVKNGTFRINGVDILVKASDTIYDLAARINSVFSDPKYADSRIIASYENGELTLRTKQASSTARIEVEAGSTNFTEIAKLTENYRNSVDLGKTELGQNAHFNINGKDYDMALDLNDITDDGIYNGNNLIYLDKDGNVVTDPNDAAITIELKKTGQTTIDIGNNLLNDSVSKLQNFVNKFNSAMNASENPILSDDSEFAAFINKIKSALTSNVGVYNKITQQLADIGIIVKVTGGTNSNMGSVHMSLSKTDGKYDYVEAFYQNPQKVFDIILGDYSQPLDNTVAGVFTRLSDVLHTNLESNRYGYFKVTPRLLESQQKAIKKEITSTTFDLNELKNIAMGTDSTEGLSEYLKQLEQQYQLINEAILALNKQYSNSLTKLILNQNNSSFNPIV